MIKNDLSVIIRLMETISIPKNEYRKLKRYASAYLKITEEITKTEDVYPYDEKYIESLTRQASKSFKDGKCIEAKSIDEALAKSRKR